MKKIICGFLFVLVMIFIALFLYDYLRADVKVQEIENIVSYQSGVESYYNGYGYTFDNANVVVNPYGNSPLSALIMFETSEEVGVRVTVKGKEAHSDITYDVSSSKNHVVYVIGLYPDYDNTVILECNGNFNTFNIKTDSIGEFLVEDYDRTEGKVTFFSEDNNLGMVDSNGDIRWYMNGYVGVIERLDNGHFLLASDREFSDNYSASLVEVDMLGKVYFEYNCEHGFNGQYVLIDNNMVLLGKNYIYIVNRQSGEIIREIEIDNSYSMMEFVEGEFIIGDGNEFKRIDWEKGQLVSTDKVLSGSRRLVYEKTKLGFDFSLGLGVRFGELRETLVSNKRISLFNYDKLDIDAGLYKINIYKEEDRLVVRGNFDAKAYVILENGVSKKVYEMDRDTLGYYKYISEVGLEGEYSIYLKVGDKLYKSEYYAEFS